MAPQAGHGTMWSQKWPRRPVRGPGGAVFRPRQPDLVPELQSAAFWLPQAAALGSEVPGNSHFLGPPSQGGPCLCLRPSVKEEPRMGRGLIGGLSAHLCTRLPQVRQTRGPGLHLDSRPGQSEIKNRFDLNVGFRKKWVEFFLPALASSWSCFRVDTAGALLLRRHAPDAGDGGRVTFAGIW